jgi:hypothetical protein
MLLSMRNLILRSEQSERLEGRALLSMRGQCKKVVDVRYETTVGADETWCNHLAWRVISAAPFPPPPTGQQRVRLQSEFSAQG